MKKVFYLIITVICIFSFNVVKAAPNVYTRTQDNLRLPVHVVATQDNINDIMATPSVDSASRIYDFADLLSEQEEKALFDSTKEFKEISNYDAVIITTRDTYNYPLNTYGYNFYDYNSFAAQGLIFVIKVGGERPEIFMGCSAPEGEPIFNLYNNDRIGQILKYVYTDISNGNYYTSCSNYVKIIKGFYEKENGNGNNLRVDENGNVISIVPILEIFILALALAIIVIYVFVGKLNKNNKVCATGTDLDRKINPGTMIVKMNSDNLIDTVVSKGK